MSYVDHGRRHLPGGTDPIPGLGGGLQFNAGTYGPDNVGDSLMIETTDWVGQDFSQPNGQSPYFDPTDNFGIAIAASGGVLITSDPLNGNKDALTVNNWNVTTTQPVQAIAIDVANTFGAGQSNGIVISSYSNGSVALGVDLGIRSDGAGSPVGFRSSVHSDLGEAIGTQSHASSTSGKAIGIRAQAVSGSGTASDSIAILAVDASNNHIFEVRDDGTVHIKTGTAVIADL